MTIGEDGVIKVEGGYLEEVTEELCLSEEIRRSVSV